MKKIGIIGGGFTGTMTAVQIIDKSTEPCEIILINEKESLNRGIAYNPYSKKHLLNVITGKMSAYPDNPDHFLEWVMQKDIFKDAEISLIANSFLPRSLYGDYLCSIWAETEKIAESKMSKLKLGIKANTETFQIIRSDGKPHTNLYTIGSNLKGELWESTAVNELREQSEKLAERLKA